MHQRAAATQDCEGHKLAQPALARNLDLELVAEGVETEAQRDLLLAMGCNLAQGYLYSPAIPSKAIEMQFAGSSASSATPMLARSVLMPTA